MISLDEPRLGKYTTYSPCCASGKGVSIEIQKGTALDTTFFQPAKNEQIEASMSITNSNGTYQDLVVVRPAKDGKSVEVLVWADAKDENYTNRFVIPIDLEDIF